MDADWMRAGLEWPMRPVAGLRRVLAGGRAGRFAIGWGLLVSLVAGVRAGAALGVGFLPARFASSAFGFVLIPAILWLLGRPLGGRASFRGLAAAAVGATIHFIAVDLVWIGARAAGIGENALVPLDVLAWLWAAALLVAGTAEVQGFSRLRAFAALAIGAAAALLAALLLSLGRGAIV